MQDDNEDFLDPWPMEMRCPKCRAIFEVSFDVIGYGNMYQILCEKCSPLEN